MHVVSKMVYIPGICGQPLRTIKDRDTCVCELEVPMTEKHTQVICVKGYLWERLGYKGTLNKNDV